MIAFIIIMFLAYLASVIGSFAVAEAQDRVTKTRTPMSTASNLLVSMVPILNIGWMMSKVEEETDPDYDEAA